MTAGVHSRRAESSERSRPADARAPSYPLSQGMRVTWELSALFFGTLLLRHSSNVGFEHAEPAREQKPLGGDGGDRRRWRDGAGSRAVLWSDVHTDARSR